MKEVFVFFFLMFCTGWSFALDTFAAGLPNENEKKSIPEFPITSGTRLASAYAPGVVVLTNAVLSFDSRKRITPGSDEWTRYRTELHNADEHGAETKVMLHVVDEDGISISNAVVTVSFSSRASKTVAGQTDGEGLFPAHGRLSYEMTYIVNKKHHYETYSKFLFNTFGVRCLENGRWLPWNPTFRVTLKDIRHPVPLCARRFEAVMPADTNSLGFDFIAGDWVSPYGKGAHADMVYQFVENRKDRANYDLSITLSFPGEGNGFYMKKKEHYSALMSDHQAAASGYQSERSFRLQRVNGKYVCEERISRDDYLVFRVGGAIKGGDRSKNQYFGKLYGPLDVPHKITRVFSLTYYFNPTPNDRNIEYAPRHNLLKGLKPTEEVYDP